MFRAKSILKLFDRLVAHLSSFLTLELVPNSKGNPFSRGVKYMGWEKLLFSTENRKWYDIGSWSLCNVNRKS